MRTLKQIVESGMVTSIYHVMNPEKDGFARYEYEGRRVIDTKHSLEREVERDIGRDNINLLLKRSIDHLKMKGERFIHYLFFSKSLNQGIIVSFEPDTVNFGLSSRPSPINHVVILTVLPRGRQEVRQGSRPTEKVILESHSPERMSNMMSAYLSELFDLTLTEDDMKFDGIIDRTVDIDGKEYILYIDNGKIWDLYGATIVELD